MKRSRCLLSATVLWAGLAMSACASDKASLWSFTAPARPPVPAVNDLQHGDQIQNPIDAFVLAKLEQADLIPAPLADERTLVRRAYFDLLGMPPSPEEVEAFVNDHGENAWPKLIERLLESPHYGERWGRHWLDVVRYADSAGYEVDESYPHAWRYRDYVVQSLNNDKPYDLFVQEQIAGDEIWPDNLDMDPKRVYEISPEKQRHRDAWIGTGMYCFGPKIAESSLDARRLHHETLTDQVDTTGSVFLGLTLGCARCHDHKFDPLAQEDYFAMQAIFTGSVPIDIATFTPVEKGSWLDDYPRLLQADEARKAYKLFQQRVEERELTSEEKTEHDRLRDDLVEKIVALPEKGGSRPQSQNGPLGSIPRATVLGHERPELVKPVHLLERGELYQQRQQVDPALPAVLAEVTGRSKEVTGPFGSRKELAVWLTQDDHPLTSRVMVNRIWLWHMGQGIVTTPNDFGMMGTEPSHPKLLDWLATEFVKRKWSMKEIHRLIMTSSTYQRSSRFATEQHLEHDPQNRLLWRMNRRRLEAEALWDAVHATAGTINLKMGGPPVVPPLTEDEVAALRRLWKWPVSGDPAEHTRRGLYIIVRRGFTFPMFQVFDAADNSVSCPQRDVTTVAPQALWNLNSESVNQQARHLASRVVSEAGSDWSSRIDRLWQIVLARPPDETEKREARRYLVDSIAASEGETDDSAADPKREENPPELQALPQSEAAAVVKLCLAVYNLSEFLFVD